MVVPESTTELMKNKIRVAGGHVITCGASWKEADDYIRELLEVDDQGVYCAPFDDPAIWEGNATLIGEIVEDLDGAPDAIIASVGGGGLFCGIQMGLEDRGLLNVPVLAVETEGAASLNASLQAGELVTLPAITSIATSLGARQVAPQAFELATRPNVKSLVLSDAQAAMACCKLMDDEKIAVEAACGVSAAAIYYGLLRKVIPDLSPDSRVVLVVCGGMSHYPHNTLETCSLRTNILPGSNISADMLVDYRKKYGQLDTMVEISDRDITHII